MIDKIKIIKYLNCAEARFDTTIHGDNPDKGARVKHRVFKCEDGPGYWEESTWLTRGLEPEQTEVSFVSERQFFGKVRLAAKRVVFLPETWCAIAMAVNELERLRIKE